MWKIGPSFCFWDGPLWTVWSWSRLLKVHCLFHMREDLLDELCDIAVYMVGLGQIWPRALEACCSNLETWHECKQNCTSNLASFIDVIFQLPVLSLLKSCYSKKKVPTVVWSVCLLNTWILTPVNCRPQAVTSLEARWWRSHLHHRERHIGPLWYILEQIKTHPLLNTPLTFYTARQIRPLSCFQLHDWWYSFESSRDNFRWQKYHIVHL